MGAQHGWEQVDNIVGITKADHIWCVVKGVVISFRIKYDLSWGGSVITINSSNDGACAILFEKKISYSKVLFSSSVSEKEVHVQGVGPVMVRWGPWESHMLHADRPQQVTFLNEGRQLYSCHFERSERKPMPGSAKPVKADARDDLVYEAQEPRVPDVDRLEPQPFRVLPNITLNGSLGQQYAETLSEIVERKFNVKESTTRGTARERDTKLTIGMKEICPITLATKASDTVSNEICNETGEQWGRTKVTKISNTVHPKDKQILEVSRKWHKVITAGERVVRVTDPSTGASHDERVKYEYISGAQLVIEPREVSAAAPCV